MPSIEIEIPQQLLHKLGREMVKIFVDESRKAFAKMGWAGTPQNSGGPAIWDSFSYRVGEQGVVIESSFPFLEELDDEVEDTADRHKREAKDRRERLKMERENRKDSYQKGRLENEARRDEDVAKALAPKIRKLQRRIDSRTAAYEKKIKERAVPMKSKSGEKIWKIAPFNTQDSWLHPSIAKFSFMNVAARKCEELLGTLLVEELTSIALEQHFGKSLIKKW